MAATYLHADNDEIEDPKNFSGLALVALLLSMVGAFSWMYIHFIPVALVAIGLGIVVLTIAQSSRLSGFSQFLAMAAIAIATTTATAGQFGRILQTNSDLVFAKKTALESLNIATEGNREKVLLMMGVPPDYVSVRVSDDEDEPRGEDPLELAVERYRSSRAFVDIPNRKTKPNWKYLGLATEYPIGDSYYYRLRYQDTAQSIPATYTVAVRKSAPLYGPASATINKGKKLSDQDLTVKWYLDRIEEADSANLNQ